MKHSLSLRVGSYNLAAGRQVGHDMRVLGRDILSLGLDLVGVQEVDQFVARSGRVDTMRLLSEAAELPYHAFFRAIDLQGGMYGVGLLSRYPILETARYELSSAGHEQRVLGRARIQAGGAAFHFFVTHLSYESRDVRTVQFSEVNALVAKHAPYVLVGDFNTADYDEFSLFQGTDKVNSATHSLPTFPETGCGIDNIVYTAGSWCMGTPAILPGVHSDHCLLYADATLLYEDPTEDTLH